MRGRGGRGRRVEIGCVGELGDHDRELAAAGLERQRLGQKLTRAQQRAVRTFRKLAEHESRWKHYASIPQKDWLEMSGRAAQVVNKQAQLYSLPFGGAQVDLRAVVKALHDFLARYSAIFAADSGEGDASLAFRFLAARTKEREARAEILTRRDQSEAGDVVERAEHEQELEDLAGVFVEGLTQLSAELSAALPARHHRAIERGVRKVRAELAGRIKGRGSRSED